MGAFVSGVAPFSEAAVVLEPGMNILFGRNGVGKSRILHSMALDSNLPPSAGIELHLVAPPEPVDPTVVESWLLAEPSNPWCHLLEADDFPFGLPKGVSLSRTPLAVMHLLGDAHGRAQQILAAAGAPPHVRGAVMRLLELTADRPWTLPDLERDGNLDLFIRAALEVVRQGRFVLIGPETSGSLCLAGVVEEEGPLSHVMGQNMLRLLEAWDEPNVHGVVAQLERQHLESEEQWRRTFVEVFGDEDLPPPQPADLQGGLARAWQDAGQSSCFWPLLPVGIPRLMRLARLRDDPHWRAAAVLAVSRRSETGPERPLQVFADWRVREWDALGDLTFQSLPPPLVRTSSPDPESDGTRFSASRDPDSTFETNPDHLEAKERIEAIANEFLGLLVEDAPRLELYVRDPAGDAAYFRWGLLDWMAEEQGGSRIHIGNLSDAQRRWALFAIELSLWVSEGAPDRARFVFIDEPERGMHRLGERRLARGLAELANQLGLTLVTATHSPAFLRLPGARLNLVRRDADGEARVDTVAVRQQSSTTLGISRSERSELLEAVVLVPDELDREIFRGLLEGTARERWIEVESIIDVVDVEDDDSLIDRLIRNTDTPIFVAADWDQFPDGTDLPGPIDSALRSMVRRPHRNYGLPELLIDWERDEVTADTWELLSNLSGPSDEDPEGHPAPLERLVGALTQVDGSALAEDGQHRIKIIPFHRTDLLMAVAADLEGTTSQSGADLVIDLELAWEDHYRSPTYEPIDERILRRVGLELTRRHLREAASRSDHVPRPIVDILEALEVRTPRRLNAHPYRDFVASRPPGSTAPDDIPF